MLLLHQSILWPCQSTESIVSCVAINCVSKIWLRVLRQSIAAIHGYIVVMGIAFVVYRGYAWACHFPVIFDNSRLIISDGHFECMITDT